MNDGSGTIRARLVSEDGAKIRRALAADQRVGVLALLSRRAMNVNEIAAALGISQPTASTHIRALEEAGLIECEYASTGKGSECQRPPACAPPMVGSCAPLGMLVSRC